jgi:two-component system, response regulator PdtaR
MTDKKPSILIVEDDGLIALHLQELLQKAGYDVPDMVPSGEDAIECMRASIPDLILMDIALDRKLDGHRDPPAHTEEFRHTLIFLTAHSETKLLIAAVDLAPYGFLRKPFDVSYVVSALERHCTGN